MDLTSANITELVIFLKEEGDRILDAHAKLSLSTNILHKINMSFNRMFKKQQSDGDFEVLNLNDVSESVLDLQFVYEFFQKTIGLKLTPGDDILTRQCVVDLNVFRSLKLLEIHRFSLNLVKGIKSLRTQLQYLTCMRSLDTLREVLEWCGADKSRGFVWSELTEAVFSHNDLSNLDASLEFTPCLQALDLSHNRLKNAQSLNCLPNLRYLNLSFNQLISLPALSCRKLEVLVVRNNYIEDIQEVSLLSKLTELDLRENCLLEHVSLCPLSSLSKLRMLKLAGNPLSFHAKHRHQTIKYLHPSTSMNFVLDCQPLSRRELSLVSTIHPMQVPSEILPTSATSQVALHRTQHKPLVEKSELCDDCSKLQNVQTSSNNADRVERETQTNANMQDVLHISDMIGMQDSGFVTELRPASPSASSIGKS